MRKLTLRSVFAGVIGVAASIIPLAKPAHAQTGTYKPNLTNGRTMFYAGGCVSCHASLNQDNRLRLGGGYGIKSPFGTFYAPNISPDPNDGIGRWSEAEFVAAVVTGTSPSGGHYYPSFPYASYQRMKIEDVRDLFAFLKTLPPVSGKIRDHDLRFPFNIRPLAGGSWKFLFLDGKPFRPDPSKSAQWNRGAYLVNGPAHCAECHSPRNPLGAIIDEQRFAGGPNPEGEGWVPNITQKELSSWSEVDFVQLLETGDTPDGDTVGGSMAPVVRNTSQLSAEDRRAMAIYLKSLAPIDGPTPPGRN